jgi:SAM-dependent MidA family methyltransferase
MPSDRPNPSDTARSLRELPEPGPEAKAHSARLCETIDEAISDAGGCLPFDRYMALALYAPGLGYYSAGSRKLGEAGDFVTAPEISPLFSRTLAQQVAEVLRQVGGSVLEFGAGSGVMAADVLLELEVLGALPERYFIIEVSADLRERQRETLQVRAPGLLDRVRWLDGLPEPGFRGAILANEVLDAMPVARFRITGEDPVELCVRRSEQGFEWGSAAPGPRLAGELQRLAPVLDGLPVGYESELNVAADDWVHALGGFLEAGAALIIDYGFPRREYYHPQRVGGTLMCHYRHRAHPNPLILPGLQDITAHVDFTAVAEAALEAGLSVSGFTNQANFLLANGLAELAGYSEDMRRQVELAVQIKKLTLPTEMGELFKVMALTRALSAPLRGFTLRDDRARL